MSAWTKQQAAEGGKAIKGEQPRDKVITLRLSEKELDLLDQICTRRKEKHLRHSSRSDVIMDAVKLMNTINPETI